MKTRTKLGAVLAGGALSLSMLGGGAAVMVAEAEPAHAVVTGSKHKPKRFICVVFGICSQEYHCPTMTKLEYSRAGLKCTRGGGHWDES